MEQNKYYKVTITYPRAARRIAEEIELIAMDEFLCGGIEEFSLNEATVDDYLGARSYSGGDIPQDVLDEVEDKVHDNEETPYHYYFYQDGQGHDARTNAQDFVVTVCENYPELKTKFSEEAVEDWNQEWKKHYNPIMIAESLEIIPIFFKDSYKPIAATPLYIDPGMGFGTGSHETTFLCLKIFCQLVEKNQLATNPTILDFGCGSGILGLATLKMVKTRKVDLYDIDENSLNNTSVNLDLNQVKSGYSLYLPKNRQEFLPSYDLIFANILLPILENEYTAFKRLMKPGSYLILSGVLNEQVSLLLDCYLKDKAYVVSSQFTKGDWSAILLQRQ